MPRTIPLPYGRLLQFSTDWTTTPIRLSKRRKEQLARNVLGWHYVISPEDDPDNAALAKAARERGMLLVWLDPALHEALQLAADNCHHVEPADVLRGLARTFLDGAA